MSVSLPPRVSSDSCGRTAKRPSRPNSPWANTEKTPLPRFLLSGKSSSSMSEKLMCDER